MVKLSMIPIVGNSFLYFSNNALKDFGEYDELNKGRINLRIDRADEGPVLIPTFNIFLNKFDLDVDENEKGFEALVNYFYASCYGLLTSMDPNKWNRKDLSVLITNQAKVLVSLEKPDIVSTSTSYRKILEKAYEDVIDNEENVDFIVTFEGLSGDYDKEKVEALENRLREVFLSKRRGLKSLVCKKYTENLIEELTKTWKKNSRIGKAEFRFNNEKGEVIVNYQQLTVNVPEGVTKYAFTILFDATDPGYNQKLAAELGSIVRNYIGVESAGAMMQPDIQPPGAETFQGRVELNAGVTINGEVLGNIIQDYQKKNYQNFRVSELILK